MKRRTLLRAIGTAAVGTTAVAGVTGAVTDPSNASANEVYASFIGDYNYESWDTGRVRVYGIDEYSESDVDAVCSDVEDFLSSLANQESNISGFRLRGFTTNLDPFTGDYASNGKYQQADEYVDAFGHDSFGGGNVWLVTRDSGGDNGTLDRPHNCAFGPKPYANDSSLNFQYPHSFTRDNTVQDNGGNDIHWAACHELTHQMARTEYYSDALPNTSRDHELASTVCDSPYCYDQSSTVMARPSNTDLIESGDCTGNASAADSYSLYTSSCTRTAIDETRLGVKNN